MYVHPFKVPVGGSFTIPIPTRGTDGGAVTGNTLADADFAFTKNGSTTLATIAAAATTPSTDFGTVTGRNQLVIDTSQDTDFDAGSYWHVWLTKTIDGIAVQECIAVFFMETAAEKAARLFNERMNPDNEIATVTGNTLSAINLSEVVPSTTAADDIVGELLAVSYTGGTFAAFTQIVRVTAYAVTNQLASVVALDGGTLKEAVGVGDWVWRVGQDGTYRNGSPLAVTGDEMDFTDAPNPTAITAIQNGLATPSDVNTQALDVISVDTYAELSATPSATPTIAQMIMWLYMKARNKMTNDGTNQTVANDAGTVISDATVSDVAGTVTRDKYADP